MSSSTGGRCLLGSLLRDVAFVTIGFGVLGFQRAQVLRRELTERLQAPAR